MSDVPVMEELPEKDSAVMQSDAVKLMYANAKSASGSYSRHRLNLIPADRLSFADKEHKMTLLQGIRLYPKAVAWSLLISTCIAMEGKLEIT